MKIYGKTAESTIANAFEAAKETYAAYGVDVEKALEKFKDISVSINCWQGDDVTGLEAAAGGVSGGIMATGNYPYKATTGDQLRGDLDKALSLLPGKHKVNIHASYAELEGAKVDRDEYDTVHFSKWIEWAKSSGIGLDFNPTTFGHPKAVGELTLSNPDSAIRKFWIDHVKQSRKIAEDIGRELGQVCVNNVWVQDGLKDFPADRFYYRSLLKDSLDQVFAVKRDPSLMLDGVESKVFGVGAESYTVGSHEFYMSYLGHAQAGLYPDLMLTMDMGHYHPTETINDKLSSVLLFSKNVLLHVSRPVRWDSDHVVVYTDDLNDVMRELARMDAYNRTFIALDFFDGSINRIGAWAIGTRATLKSILGSLLEPSALLKEVELSGDFTTRLALTDEFRVLPVEAVWNMYCLRNNIPTGTTWLEEIKNYERDILSKRG